MNQQTTHALEAIALTKQLEAEKEKIKADLLKLTKSVLKWSEMPRAGDGKYQSDFVYAAEVMAPLAERLQEKYSTTAS